MAKRNGNEEAVGEEKGVDWGDAKRPSYSVEQLMEERYAASHDSTEELHALVEEMAAAVVSGDEMKAEYFYLKLLKRINNFKS